MHHEIEYSPLGVGRGTPQTMKEGLEGRPLVRINLGIPFPSDLPHQLVLLINLITMYPKARYFITHGKWWADMYFDGVHKYLHLSLAWSSLLFTYWILAVFYPSGTPQTMWAITNSILYSLMSIPLLALKMLLDRPYISYRHMLVR
mmetsp:Transcript_23844/g.20290  ORF Transcript_23844/g.20290 Transcript_23844/m.20290 type:complete len:146 (+) Transcript_23844:177-614(+)